MSTEKRVPPHFLWGAATSSFQIEGATQAGGRGESIWDVFCREEGRVLNGDHGDVACGHYDRWEEDLDLMASLGLKAYRFSIAWPRIFPDGTGTVPNEEGLAFYSRLVDGLLKRGIEPWVTLYHWDLPQALQENGGWLNRDTMDAFVAYADCVSKALGGRVKHWITHNEPWVIAHLGHVTGEHAPGEKKQWLNSFVCSHHLLVSHGRAVPIIRRNSPGCKVGMTVNLCPAIPASASDADADATRHFDGFFNRWYLDPLFGRGYPADIVDDYVAQGRLPDNALDFVKPGDLQEAGVETDFLGINYYSGAIIRSSSIPEEENAPRIHHESPDSERTAMGWPIQPELLEALLLRLHNDYAPQALVITENGASYPTTPDEDGRIRDVKRQSYFRSHIAACQRAIEQGSPLVAYFAWSLLDNFEWAFGYSQRFGLVYVDYETLERTPKDSAHLYSRIIANNGLVP
ncbi:MAG: GH1 family beta-glucosidase [Myxococcota bacterium]|nr:GH1 family beta-glucosidase [Myxococcota bacterium]